ncbi:glutathione peroxidase [Listeria aquatica]|uniref:Glutathione peroxidase n=1 Tax=Listeria aquatica FSL S10-1188 TaxID=1265818 RepID=W7B3N4_9LIST|nr:glutathione peroxidase [Listeria aquatica]EUJ19790.1 glutathione peroxidase [Listeria aquatica FSL S10-1188]
MNVHDFKETTMAGEEITLDTFKGKVILIVNTASKCGLTPQLEGLEKLYETYQNEGLEILGFPCNQFLRQDPGTNEEILAFCERNYGVTFPMFQKIKVNGKEADPLYKYLVKETGGKKIEWNFAKFLVDRDGNIVERFSSKTKPEAIEATIQTALAK